MEAEFDGILKETHTKRFPYKVWAFEELDVGIECVHVNMDDVLTEVSLGFELQKLSIRLSRRIFQAPS